MTRIKKRELGPFDFSKKFIKQIRELNFETYINSCVKDLVFKTNFESFCKKFSKEK